MALDPDTLAFIAAFGSDHQSGTHDIDFDMAGHAYVADTHNNRVTIYKMNGTHASLTGQIDERIRGPEGVLAHPNGMIYVAGAWSGNVIAYQDGKVVSELNGLSSPHDLERTPSKPGHGRLCWLIQNRTRQGYRRSQSLWLFDAPKRFSEPAVKQTGSGSNRLLPDHNRTCAIEIGNLSSQKSA